MNRSKLLLFVGAALATTAAFAGTPDLTVSAESSPRTALTVTEQRITDQRIQAAVIEVLSRDERLSGRIGVETHDQVVNLSGQLMSPAQVTLAGRGAGKVTGVKYVVNDIRPKFGRVGS